MTAGLGPTPIEIANVSGLNSWRPEEATTAIDDR
jgi:hypothetical protein